MTIEAKFSAVTPDRGWVDATVAQCGPRVPDYTEPCQCALCGDYQVEGEVFTLLELDLDPGSAERGPAPQIGDYPVCPGCRAAR